MSFGRKSLILRSVKRQCFEISHLSTCNSDLYDLDLWERCRTGIGQNSDAINAKQIYTFIRTQDCRSDQIVGQIHLRETCFFHL